MLVFNNVNKSFIFININGFSRRFISKIPLTKEKYNIKRRNYSKLEEKHLDFFKDLLGANRIITNKNDCQGYNTDWFKKFRGDSQCVLKPKTTEEVSSILAYCNQHRLAICPQGGNTGVVGGSVPVFDEIILSTSLMNQIIHFDETSNVIVCQSGCILENIENYLDKYDLMMPLDLGAKGSCHIGGNVSTNAGGLRLMRYGSLHGNILGLEAVTANGEVIDCLSTLKKDNTGYHLKHIFIGSEGTLGVVTKVAIQCPPKPKAINVAFLGIKSYENVLKVLKKSKQQLSEILSSCELIDALSLDLVTTKLHLKSPLKTYPFYMLIETHGSNESHDEDKMNTLIDNLFKADLIEDGVTTNEPNKMRSIWELRERIPEAFNLDGYVFMYDVSICLQEFYTIVPLMRKKLGNLATRVFGFGHLGDGNLHFHVTVKEYDTHILQQIEPFLYEFISKHKGSISSEHGIGCGKKQYLHYSKTKNAINLMRKLKLMLDPNGILNPYKVIPEV